MGVPLIRSRPKASKSLFEPFALQFPRITDSPGVVALLTPAMRQASRDPAAELHYVGMVPLDLLGVIIGLGQTTTS